MKKIIPVVLALVMIMSMAVPAYAVTPTLQIPDMPEISKIKIEVKLDDQVAENAVKAWLREHPIKFDFSKIKLLDWGT